jgi:hypothetical protein
MARQKYTIVTSHLKNCLKIKNENEKSNEISNIDSGGDMRALTNAGFLKG